MASEPASYRMVFVAAKQGDGDRWHSGHELWRQAAEQSFVAVEFSAYDAIAARAALAKERVDFCVLDSRLPLQERSLVLRATNPTYPRPKIVVAGLAMGIAESAIDFVLPAPTDARAAQKLINLCLRTKVPTRALIIDDSAVMRSIVRKVLSGSKFAFDVAEASDGPAALAYMEQSSIGIVFTDFQMAGMNGLEVLAHIRRLHPRVAVVIITSSTNDVIADKAHTAGVFAFLRKPFFSEDVDLVMQKYLQYHPLAS
ncbi:MAG TPA: response regulator [Nitrospiraceae bacterium]|nr:response regulator [Nitrospiraceae bacterium]